MKKYTLLSLIATASLIYPKFGSTNSAFIAYEFGEMAFNSFKNFAGEIGYNFDNEHSVRFSYMNVALSERHLSSNEANAVRGDNVEGLWRGFDIYYDYPVYKSFYVSPSIGYHDTEFSHLQLNESARYSSATAGVGFSYLGDNVLGIKELYWRFSVTFNYRFNPIDETRLGDSTVTGSTIDYYPQIFIGYAFE